MGAEAWPAHVRAATSTPHAEEAATRRWIQRRGGMAKMVMGVALAAACLLNIASAHEAAATTAATRGAAPGLRGATRGRGVPRGRGGAPGVGGASSQGGPAGAVKRGGLVRGRGKPAAPAVRPLVPLLVIAACSLLHEEIKEGICCLCCLRSTSTRIGETFSRK
jgi:hypothetical protein